MDGNDVPRPRVDAADTGTAPVIEVHNLRMRYGTKDVLTGMDFTVRRGEVVALLGPNGAGKSTTIEILEGFRKRSAGRVEVLGVDPDHGDEAWRARLGIVLQSWRDHGRWRVRQLLAHFGRYYRPYGTPDRPRPFDVDDLIAMVGLTEQGESRVGALSGGQRRRLDVAIGLVGRPDLLFLDEPTTGFDPEARQDFHNVVQQLTAADDMTVLLTTHDLHEAEKLADRILILAGGIVVADGSPAQLATRVASKAEVRYSIDGRPEVRSVDDATTYVRGLFERHGQAVGDLEIRRANLEDVYLTMVRNAVTGQGTEVPRELSGAKS